MFVDFEEAVYEISYDLDEQKSEVTAKIKMNVPEAGYPVFDLVESPKQIRINGIYAGAALVATPSNETKVRVINRVLPIGTYTLDITAPLTNLVEYGGEGLRSAFWVSDSEDRFYLERYIPVNFEFDRVKMTFNLSFKGLKNKQHIFTNGQLTWIAEDRAQILFPKNFTVNSLYFHTTPVDAVDLLETSFKSVDGRDIPVRVYMAKAETSEADLAEMRDLALREFRELEGSYGHFPHPSLTIYNASLDSMGLGGMEYAGATVSNPSSIAHELFHSYFGRAVTPANGNAGWIDESLATWHDLGYFRTVSLNDSTSMASHPTYTRKTDGAAYSFGGRFMALLNNKFGAKGGLKPFLRKLLEKKIFTPIFTEDFVKEMELFYGESLQEYFQKYVYKPLKAEKSRAPFHRKPSLQELRTIL